MTKREFFETHQMGFNPNPKQPYFWINFQQEYFALCVDDLLSAKAATAIRTKQYLEYKTPFKLTEERFGFGGVGTFRRLDNGTVQIRVYITNRKYLRHSILTLQSIAMTMSRLHVDQALVIDTGREQVMSIWPGTHNEPKGHGISGDIFPVATQVLQKGLTNDEHAAINACMQAVWTASAPQDIVGYVEEVGLCIHADKRPELCCFGFGVTSGVMPQHTDQVWKITSDNMDAPYQSVTFLAGWFTLANTLWLKVHKKQLATQ